MWKMGTLWVPTLVTFLVLLLMDFQPITGKPTEKIDHVTSERINHDYYELQALLGKNLEGSTEEKAKIVDLMLQLLSEIDLPTLCEVIANDSKPVSKHFDSATAKTTSEDSSSWLEEMGMKSTYRFHDSIPTLSTTLNTGLPTEEATKGMSPKPEALPYSGSTYMGDFTNNVSKKPSVFNKLRQSTYKFHRNDLNSVNYDPLDFGERLTEDTNMAYTEVPDNFRDDYGEISASPEQLDQSSDIDMYDNKITSDGTLSYPVVHKERPGSLYNLKIKPAYSTKELKQMRLRSLYNRLSGQQPIDPALRPQGDLGREGVVVKSVQVERPRSQLFSGALVLGDWNHDDSNFEANWQNVEGEAQSGVRHGSYQQRESVAAERDDYHNKYSTGNTDQDDELGRAGSLNEYDNYVENNLDWSRQGEIADKKRAISEFKRNNPYRHEEQYGGIDYRYAYSGDLRNRNLAKMAKLKQLGGRREYFKPGSMSSVVDVTDSIAGADGYTAKEAIRTDITQTSPRLDSLSTSDSSDYDIIYGIEGNTNTDYPDQLNLDTVIDGSDYDMPGAVSMTTKHPTTFQATGNNMILTAPLAETNYVEQVTSTPATDLLKLNTFEEIMHGDVYPTTAAVDENGSKARKSGSRSGGVATEAVTATSVLNQTGKSGHGTALASNTEIINTTRPATNPAVVGSNPTLAVSGATVTGDITAGESSKSPLMMQINTTPGSPSTTPYETTDPDTRTIQTDQPTSAFSTSTVINDSKEPHNNASEIDVSSDVRAREVTTSAGENRNTSNVHQQTPTTEHAPVTYLFTGKSGISTNGPMTTEKLSTDSVLNVKSTPQEKENSLWSKIPQHADSPFDDFVTDVTTFDHAGAATDKTDPSDVNTTPIQNQNLEKVLKGADSIPSTASGTMLTSEADMGTQTTSTPTKQSLITASTQSTSVHNETSNPSSDNVKILRNTTSKIDQTSSSSSLSSGDSRTSPPEVEQQDNPGDSRISSAGSGEDEKYFTSGEDEEISSKEEAGPSDKQNETTLLPTQVHEQGENESYEHTDLVVSETERLLSQTSSLPEQAEKQTTISPQASGNKVSAASYKAHPNVGLDRTENNNTSFMHETVDTKGSQSLERLSLEKIDNNTNAWGSTALTSTQSQGETTPVVEDLDANSGATKMPVAHHDLTTASPSVPLNETTSPSTLHTPRDADTTKALASILTSSSVNSSHSHANTKAMQLDKQVNNSIVSTTQKYQINANDTATTSVSADGSDVESKQATTTRSTYVTEEVPGESKYSTTKEPVQFIQPVHIDYGNGQGYEANDETATSGDNTTPVSTEGHTPVIYNVKTSTSIDDNHSTTSANTLDAIPKSDSDDDLVSDSAHNFSETAHQLKDANTEEMKELRKIVDISDRSISFVNETFNGDVVDITDSGLQLLNTSSQVESGDDLVEQVLTLSHNITMDHLKDVASKVAKAKANLTQINAQLEKLRERRPEYDYLFEDNSQKQNSISTDAVEVVALAPEDNTTPEVSATSTSISGTTSIFTLSDADELQGVLTFSETVSEPNNATEILTPTTELTESSSPTKLSSIEVTDAETTPTTAVPTTPGSTTMLDMTTDTTQTSTPAGQDSLHKPTEAEQGPVSGPVGNLNDYYYGVLDYGEPGSSDNYVYPVGRISKSDYDYGVKSQPDFWNLRLGKFPHYDVKHKKPESGPYMSGLSQWMRTGSSDGQIWPHSKPTSVTPWKAYNIALAKQKSLQKADLMQAKVAKPEARVYADYKFDANSENTVDDFLWKARPWPRHEISKEALKFEKSKMIADKFGKETFVDTKAENLDDYYTKLTDKLQKLRKIPNVKAQNDWGNRFSQGYYGRVFDGQPKVAQFNDPMRWSPSASRDMVNFDTFDRGVQDNTIQEFAPNEALKNQHITLHRDQTFHPSQSYVYDDAERNPSANKDTSQSVQIDNKSPKLQTHSSTLVHLGFHDEDNSPQNSAASVIPKDAPIAYDVNTIKHDVNLPVNIDQIHQWKSQAAAPTTGSVPAPDDYQCPGLFGYHRDPANCQAFFICSWGMPYRVTCPEGTLWNPAESVCDWAVNVRCPVNQNDATLH